MTTTKNIPALRFPEFEGEWQNTLLKNILKRARLGGNYENSDIEKGVPLIKMGNIDRGRINTDKLQYLPENFLYNNEDILKEGDFLFNTRNTLELVGKVAIWRNELPLAVYNSNLLKLDFTYAIEGSNRFINYCFNTNLSIKRLRNYATGTTSVAAIYTKDLLNLKISYPTLPEQQKIASFLASVDQRIHLLSQKKEKLEQYKKGIMQRIFSQQLRFRDENGKEYPEWEEKKIGQIAKVFSGGTPKSSRKEYFMGTIPFIKSGEINSSRTEQYLSEQGYQSSSAKMVRKGDLLLAIYGATSGEAAISKISGAINQAILCLRGEFNNTFLLNWLKFNKDIIISTYLQGGQGNLSGEIVKGMTIWLPSNIEQQKIATFLSSIDDKINHINSQIELTRKWKQGLLQKMFV